MGYTPITFTMADVLRLCAFLLIAGMLAPAVALAYSDAIEERIQRVINGLLPATPFQNSGRYGEPAALQDRMAHHQAPGVSIAVINDGKIEWARGFGVKAWGKPDPVTAETRFQAASISKPVFALVVMRLVEMGKLNLDEDVNTCLRSWKVPPNASWQPAVTLRQILSHSGGLTVHGFPGYRRTDDLPALVEILDGKGRSNTGPILVNLLPGVQARYSGGGTTVAQQLVVDVLGKPFPEIMADLVLRPLNLAHSTYEQPLPEALAESASTAHDSNFDIVEGKWHVYPEMAAAGLWTTPSDLARIGIELQQTLKGEPSRLLPKEAIEEMLTPQIEDDVGIGFLLDGEGETVRFEHSGGNEGFRSIIKFYKNLGMGAVIMVNSNPGGGLIPEIERAIAAEYGWPGYFPEEKVVVDVAEDALRACTGDYASESGLRFTITQDGGSLFLKLGNQSSLEIYPQSETAFFARAVNATVTFEKAEDGQVTGLTLQQEGKRVSAERKP